MALMIEKKKKILFIQITLLVFGLAMIYGTYYIKKPETTEEFEVSSANKKIDKEDIDNALEEKDIFFNIEYNGIDLAGNRYILKSEEAFLDEIKPEIVYMKRVKATFYFKDGTVLYVQSNDGVYNNKTLDMKFEQNVKANYLNNELFAEKADYSNKESYLSIYEKVRINSDEGNLVADKLLFDVKYKKLDITSFKDGSINANVKLNEKRF